MNTRSTAGSTGYTISASCPGCGAAVEFGADLFVTVCEHCRSPLRLILPLEPPAYFIQSKRSLTEQRFAIDRFCKTTGEPLPSSLYSRAVLFPYWKVDGVMLKVRNEMERREVVSEYGGQENPETVETERRNITLTPFSITTPAADVIEGIPASVGLRAQYLTVLPLAQDKLPNDTDLVSITVDKADALAQAQKMSKALSTLSVPEFGKNSNRFFPLSYSLIFFPFTVFDSYHEGKTRRFVVDALNGEVHTAMVPEQPAAMLKQESHDAIANHQVSLAFHRCPNCGDNLPERQSYFYLCTNCGQNIGISGAYPPETSVQCVTMNKSSEQSWFPFWSFSGRVVPAFRSGNYEAMFRLTRRVSGAIPKLTTQPLSGSTLQLMPVQITLTEAAAIALADEAKMQEERQHGKVVLPENLPITDPSLLFIPFHQEQYFYIDSCLKAITFEQAAVAGTRREPVAKSGV